MIQKLADDASGAPPSSHPNSSETAENLRGERQASPVRERWTKIQVYTLFLLTLVVALNYIDRGILSVLQEAIKHDLHLSDSQLGLLAGPAFGILYAMSSLPSARLAERFSRPAILGGLVALWSGMTALCGAAGGFVQMAAFRLGVGMGEGGAIPITTSLVAETFKVKHRGMALAILDTGKPIAGIVTPLLAAWLAVAYGWRVAFFALGVPGILVALLIIFTLREPRNDRVKDSAEAPRASFLKDVRFLFSQPAFTLLFLMAIVGMISRAGIGSFEVSYLIRSGGLTMGEAARIAAGASVAGLLGAWVGGYIADRFLDARGRSYLLVTATGSFLTCMAFLVAFSQTSIPIIAAALVFAGFASNLKDGPVYAAIQCIALSRMRATAMAVHMIGATVIGGSLGPMLSGFTSDLLASNLYTGPSTYVLSCPGGRPLAGASADIIAACAHASSEGLRTSLFIFSCGLLLAMTFTLWACRYMKINDPEDQRQVDETARR